MNVGFPKHVSAASSSEGAGAAEKCTSRDRPQRNLRGRRTRGGDDTEDVEVDANADNEHLDRDHTEKIKGGERAGADADALQTLALKEKKRMDPWLHDIDLTLQLYAYQ